MKRELRGIAIGILIMLMITVSFADGVSKTIEVYFNSVGLKLNGSAIAADTILYEGTTYIPVRTAAKIFDKKVLWDQEAKIAGIYDKDYTEESSKSSDKSIKARARIEAEYADLKLLELSYSNLPILRYEEWDTEFKNAVMIGVLSKFHRTYLEVGDLEPNVWVDFENQAVYAGTIKADNSILLVHTDWKKEVDEKYIWTDLEKLK